ncbi:ABC transporter substrate-binding protein [uncultured Phenylobacterium sp.]|uniref:ABC transporter substrate-binding protein n=1 Tax=uncultured Phenylobacterium sp. TaxID=349273 RepID=UPI0025DA7273|nr:ABC transporter substrate-binding protein [uncultured Phenylobacterium sp.]
MGRVRRLLAIAAAAAALSQPAAGAAKPMRIMSMSMCTDLLILQLVPKGRVASVTYLAHDGANVLFPGADAGIVINHGTPEDIVNLKPDLILAGDFSTALTRKLARRVGARIVEVKSATTLADIRANLRRLGAEVGEPARAEALVRRMDATLAGLAATAPPHPMRGVVWSGGSTVPGRDGLNGAIVAAAGGRNIAAAPGIADSTFGIEQLLAARPQALLYETARPGVRSLTTDAGAHRVVRRLYAGRRIGFNGVVHACGLPQSADGAAELRRALRALPPGGPPS